MKIEIQILDGQKKSTHYGLTTLKKIDIAVNPVDLESFSKF